MTDQNSKYDEKLAVVVQMDLFDNKKVDEFAKKFDALSHYCIKPLGLMDCSQEKTTD